MRLQVDMEFQKNVIKELNKKFNVEMFAAKIREGKAFPAEQKIYELKKKISNLNLINSKMIPNKLISKFTANMIEVESGKYGLSPNYIERQSLQSEKFRVLFNFERIKKANKTHNSLDKYDVSLYAREKRNLHLI